MRYRLRTLMIVLALGPPVLAGAYFLGMADPGVLMLTMIVVLAVYVMVEPWLMSPQIERPRD